MLKFHFNCWQINPNSTNISDQNFNKLTTNNKTIYELVWYLSSLLLSFNKNFSLSSSATLTSLSSKCFLSSGPRLSTSTSLDSPVDPKSKPFLNRSKVGSFSREAHLRASSSSSSREDLEKTSIPEFLHTEVLSDLKLDV
ncbi:hypothetical protein HanIR_Chr09g0447091 [Helianthus annuus]|nr:hypothetical protein HanIR_Chr09g0447091 [Helianthus annuus]